MAYTINNYFKPFTIIALLILLCNPIYNVLTRNKLLNNKISAIIALVIVNLIFIILIIFLGNFLFARVGKFVLKDYSYFIQELQNNISKLSNVLSINFNDIIEKMELHNYNLINSNFLKRGAAYTTDGIFSYFIGNMAAYFILSDKYRIISMITKVIPNLKYDLIKFKFYEINKILEIELILVLITTLITILGFMALNIKNAFILGSVCGILDIIPIIGIIIVFLPLVLIEFSEKKYIIVFGLIFFYIALQLIRQIMEAKFMSNNLKLHPLLIIISIYIGINLWGFIGIFLMIIYVMSAKEILEI